MKDNACQAAGQPLKRPRQAAPSGDSKSPPRKQVWREKEKDSGPPRAQPVSFEQQLAQQDQQRRSKPSDFKRTTKSKCLYHPRGTHAPEDCYALKKYIQHQQKPDEAGSSRVQPVGPEQRLARLDQHVEEPFHM